jgi:hypothetical protein
MSTEKYTSIRFQCHESDRQLLAELQEALGEDTTMSAGLRHALRVAHAQIMASRLLNGGAFFPPRKPSVTP